MADNWGKRIADGWTSALDHDQNIGTVAAPVYVRSQSIKDLVHDRYIIEVVELWTRTKRWGLPFGGGWASQPAWCLDILELMDEADVKYGKREIRG